MVYPSLLQLRVVPPVVPPDNVLHNTHTTEHVVDAVLRPFPSGSGTVTTTATTTAASIVVVASVIVAGAAIANCYRCYCWISVRIHRYECR